MAGLHPKAGIVLPLDGGPGHVSRAKPFSPSSGIHDGRPAGRSGLRPRQPVGYALRAAHPVGSEDGYNIVVLDDSGAVLLTLGPFCEADVVATWRALGDHSGLPLLIEHGTGDLRPACDQIGRVRLGRVRIRRRHAFLSGRRPRFLVKRKPGQNPARSARLRRGEES